METQAKLPTTLKDIKILSGRWKLNFKLVNPNGERGFAGKALSSYTDPLTKKARHLFNPDGQMLPLYLIEKVNTFLNPSENYEHLILVDWLLGHPDVGVSKEYVKMDGAYFFRKDKNPRLTLINLDHQNLGEIDDEEYIDGLVGLINMNTGVHALSLPKLRYILADVNMSYRDAKYMTDKNVEKKFLRKSLKTFVRQSMANAKEVRATIENLEGAKFHYEIKEMLRVDVLTKSGGMFKYRGSGIGISMESVVKYFKENPEFYKDVSDELYELIKTH